MRGFGALELYDVLTNLVPGAVFLLFINIVFELEKYISPSAGALWVSLFLIISLVTGHLIQAVASFLDGTPTLFGEVIRATRGSSDGDPSISITHIEESIWPMMQHKFKLPDDFDDYGVMFRLLLSYTETTPANRALRFQALHSFHRCMWAVGWLSAMLTILGILLKFMGGTDIRSWNILGMSLAGSLVSIFIFSRRKKKMNKRFIQYALADFYISNIALNDQGFTYGS